MSMQAIEITCRLLHDYETYLQGRGCYAASTIKSMVSGVRRLTTILGIREIPIDEDAAVALVNRMCRSRSSADGYKFAVRGLLEFCRAEGSS